MSNKEIFKILIATGIYPPDIGGPATYVKTLHKELIKYGFQIKIVTYGESARTDNVCYISRRQNILFRYLKYSGQIWQLSKKADVIYAFDIVSSGLPCALVKFFRPKVKLIVRLGGDFLWEKAFNNGWTSEPLGSYYSRPKTFKEKFFIILNKFVLGRCEKIIFSTNWQKEICKKHFGLPEERIIVIKNAFPETVAATDAYNGEQINILFAGRLIKLKNLGSVFKAIAEIEGITLNIVGDGPERENLTKEARKASVNGRINFLPKMPRNELFEEILKSCLVIVPSVTEVSPNIVLECIKLHKPVLVTRECGFYDEYRDKLIFIDPFNIYDIREKIEYLLNKCNYQNYISRIKSINSDRSFLNIAQEHINLFKEL